MYNAIQKERYLKARTEDGFTSIRRSSQFFFAITETMEERLDKDCSCFTVTEIKDMYASFMSHSIDSLKTINSQLKNYTSWCIKENLVPDNQNHYFELDDKEFYEALDRSLIDIMFISREDLLKLLPRIPNVSDQFLVLALFEGLYGKHFSDFHELTMAQFEGNRVDLGERTLEVSDKLLELAEESAHEYTRYDYDRVALRGYRKTDPSIIKYGDNAKADVTEKRTMRNIQARLAKLEEEFGKVIGFYCLRNSGRVDFIKRKIAESGNTNLEEVFYANRDSFEYRYGAVKPISRWLKDNEKFILSSSKVEAD